ncbi:DUF7024 domain-containing protein [Oceanicoccus sagamiensis]|uniref:Uncharacterized protein n=1 Tax=Oceanicoccus sagamiensis TaxID=716816 RepID=A0A1X9NBF2_9GAMM|nr:glycosyltransferase [Oceanicoccus sagamiensis]ARN74936.1 hypothetical protein BST96_12920 [Oceanicoccus sagamiensis]
MVFILHSAIDEGSIRDNIGLPEYSYYFVLKGFLPVLEDMGEIITVKDTETPLDELVKAHRKANSSLLQRLLPSGNKGQDQPVFLSFSPPNHAPVDLDYKTLCVLAWEFSNIPSETWDDNPKNDWRYVLGKHGSAIALSTYSVTAIKEAMGEDFPVVAIPVPVWDRFQSLRDRLQGKTAINPAQLDFSGHIVDSRERSLSNEQLNPIAQKDQGAYQWNGEEVTLNFSFRDKDFNRLNGFYAPEHWGAWSRITTPWVELPFNVSGLVELTVEAHGYGANIGREITVSLGAQTGQITLTDAPVKHKLIFDLDSPADSISFSGLDMTPVEGSEDRRKLAIGICSVTLVEGAAEDLVEASADEHADAGLKLDGVVYTSIFNPSDGRKNWLDMVTAFCWAFRDCADATLVLKMTNKDLSNYMGKLNLLMSELAPYQCRIVAIHGFIEDEDYARLVSATSYYVNTSNCEGLCLPLMEYMSCGIPAIAPTNTAMKDYVDDNVAFTLRSSLEQNVWPQDPRDAFRTMRYRLDWESLRDAYLESYRVAKEDPARYQAMSDNNMNKLKQYCSDAVVKNKLQDFFASIDL